MLNKVLFTIRAVVTKNTLPVGRSHPCAGVMPKGE